MLNVKDYLTSTFSEVNRLVPELSDRAIHRVISATAPTIIKLQTIANQSIDQCQAANNLYALLDFLADAGDVVDVSQDELLIPVKRFFTYISGADVSSDTYAEFKSRWFDYECDVTVGSLYGSSIDVEKVLDVSNADLVLQRPDGSKTFIGRISVSEEGIRTTVSQSIEVSSGQHLSFDGVISAIADSVSDNALISDIVSYATFNGSITVAQLERILGKYGSAPCAQSIKDALSALNDQRPVDVLTLLSSVFTQLEAVHDEGSPYFSLGQNSRITSNVLCVVATVFSSVLPLVLNALFGVIGFIVGIVGSLITTALSSAKSALGLGSSLLKTDPVLLPCYNRYFGSLTEYSPSFSEKEFVDQHGVAAYLLEGNTLFNKLVIRTGENSYATQYVISAWPQSATGNGFFRIYYNSTTSYLTFGWFEGSAPVGRTLMYGDEWLTSSDQQRAISITNGIIGLITSLSGSTQSKAVGYVSARSIMPLRDRVKNWSEFFRYCKATPNLNTLSDQEIWNLLLCTMLGEATSGTTDNEDILVGNSLNFGWDYLTSYLSDSNMSFLESYLTSGGFIFQSTPVVGVSALDPVVRWPSTSYSAVASAEMLIVLSTAAIATSAGLITRTLKTKATTRIATRSAQLDQAKANYLNDPSKANAQALAKANRKLARSWSFAGAVGVSSYDGFSTTGSVASTNSPVDISGTLPVSGSMDVTVLDVLKTITG